MRYITGNIPTICDARLSCIQLDKISIMFLQEYEKLRVLGKGAFASVYKVRHADLGYVRALKVSHELIEG